MRGLLWLNVGLRRGSGAGVGSAGSCSRGRGGFCGFGLNREQLDFEDQGGVGADFGAGAARSIGKVSRNEKLPLGAYGHELQSFGPTLDNATNRDGSGFAAFIGTIKLAVVNQGALVIDHHAVVLS